MIMKLSSPKFYILKKLYVVQATFVWVYFNTNAKTIV